jgi:hypothetical protein
MLRVVAKPSGEPDAQIAYASPSGSCGEAKVISPTCDLIERRPKITANVRKTSGERKMEQKIMERRTVLKGGVAAVGMLGGGASSAVVAGAEQASADTPQSSLPDQILAAVQRFRETIPANFDREYIEKVVIPFFLTSFYEGERPMLPVIDVDFSKENALPYDLWGLITRDWRPTPDEGVTVFLQGLEKRGSPRFRT